MDTYLHYSVFFERTKTDQIAIHYFKKQTVETAVKITKRLLHKRSRAKNMLKILVNYFLIQKYWVKSMDSQKKSVN